MSDDQHRPLAWLITDARTFGSKPRLHTHTHMHTYKQKEDSYFNLKDTRVLLGDVTDEWPGQLRKLVLFMVGSCISHKAIAVYTHTVTVNSRHIKQVRQE